MNPGNHPTTAAAHKIRYDHAVLSRRRFMFLLGGTAAGVWLASTGLVRLDRKFVLSLAGSCSFCGKDRAEVHALVGTAGQAARICDECVGLCFDILGEEGVGPSRDPYRAAPNVEDERLQQRISDLVQGLAERNEASRSEHLIADLQRSFSSGKLISPEMFCCTFCGAHRRDVGKLISGPRVFICDSCVGDAGAVVTHVLRSV